MKKAGLIIGVLILLSACFGGYSPNSNFYRLPAMGEVKQVFASKQNIAVLKVGLPEYLDRPQMVLLDEKSPQMEIAEFHRWGEDLGVMIQRKVAADLGDYLPQAKVVVEQEEVQHANLDVKIEILRMDMMKQNEVILQAKWYIENAQGRVLANAQFYQTQKVRLSYDNYALAVARLLEEMNEQIAQAIAKI